MTTEYFEIQDYLNDKLLTEKQLVNECKKLVEYAKTETENKTSFVGNKILYNGYQCCFHSYLTF